MNEKLKSAIFELSLEEKLDLVQDLWDHIAESHAEIPLTEAQKKNWIIVWNSIVFILKILNHGMRPWEEFKTPTATPNKQ